MLQFKVLVQRSFGSIRALAGVDRTPIVPLDFVGCSSKPFFAVVVAPFALAYILSLFLEFVEFGGEFIALVDELPHLGEQDDVGEIGPAIFVIIIEVGIRIHGGIHIR